MEVLKRDEVLLEVRHGNVVLGFVPKSGASWMVVAMRVVPVTSYQSLGSNPQLGSLVVAPRNNARPVVIVSDREHGRGMSLQCLLKISCG